MGRWGDGTFNCLTPTPDSRLPTPDSRLPTPYSLLRVILTSYPRKTQTSYCYQKSSITKLMLSSTTHALKEWAVAVNALEAGKTIMLLRKGGIREQGNCFSVAHHQVLLYPTYEHQKPNLLKPDYGGVVKPVPSGWHPETVRIGSWASITDILPVTEQSTVAALLPYHIWNEEFVSERWKWKPRQPLYVLLLRTYQLPEPVITPYHQEYGGCRSWIDLVEPISYEGVVPVWNDGEYIEQVREIRSLIED
ncbi:DUF1802 family protein [Moorena producens]|nr:DUF1802 family protein [Moorena producens]